MWILLHYAKDTQSVSKWYSGAKRWLNVIIEFLNLVSISIVLMTVCYEEANDLMKAMVWSRYGWGYCGFEYWEIFRSSLYASGTCNCGSDLLLEYIDTIKYKYLMNFILFFYICYLLIPGKTSRSCLVLLRLVRHQNRVELYLLLLQLNLSKVNNTQLSVKLFVTVSETVWINVQLIYCKPKTFSFLLNYITYHI